MARVWINEGDHLRLEGYGIRIRRNPLSRQMNWWDARFLIEVDGLPDQRGESLAKAKACGEENADEIDELPVPAGEAAEYVAGDAEQHLKSYSIKD